jgi:hypothetical protein
MTDRSHLKHGVFMLKKSIVALLLVGLVLSLTPLQQVFAQENSAAKLLGTWKISHRPVNASGPCPFLPESIEFLKGEKLIMSNLPGRLLPYKTDLTATEQQAFEARSDSFKGKRLLVVKPNPRMEWTTTPMVYVYELNNKGLSLTVEGWETATFKLLK